MRERTTYTSPLPGSTNKNQATGMAHGSHRGAMAVVVGNIVAVAGILLVVAIFALGVLSLQCCFDACYRRRRASAPSPPSSQSSGDPEAPRSLPAATAYREAARPRGECACTVCLAELQDGELARFMPCCGHGFHAPCVDAWLVSHPTCPLCRITVARPPGTAPAAALPLVRPPEPASYAAELPARVCDDDHTCD